MPISCFVQLLFHFVQFVDVIERRKSLIRSLLRIL